jgi:GT2 family glycosyltransferase
MSSPAVAVAVVSWNTGELLRRCLLSLESDRGAGLAEVWVFDNASGDGSAEMVRREFPDVALIASERNVGFGPAVNAVAARTATPWIACANADVAPRPGALAKLFEASSSDPRAAALAPRLEGPGGRREESARRFPTVTRTALQLACLSRPLDPTTETEVDWAHGAFLLLRREAFYAAGGFDDAQPLFQEDLDLCWRLRRRGGSVLYVPAAVFDHVGGAAVSQAHPGDRLERETVALYRWMARRRGAVVTRAYALVSFAGLAVRLPLFAVLAQMPGRGDRWREKLRRARVQITLHRRALVSPGSAHAP